MSGLLQNLMVMCVANKEYWSENYVRKEIVNKW